MPSKCLAPGLATGALFGLSLTLAGCISAGDRRDLPQPAPLSAYAADKSLAGRDVPWPSDEWWTSYRDPQLGALIRDGLRDASQMRIAAARLALARAAIGPAEGALLPTLGASAKVDQERQSYHYLINQAAVPKGWNDGGLASLDFNWEIDFWGKNRAALAAARGEAQAAAAEAAATRLAVSTGIAEAYARLAALYAERDATTDAIRVRKKTVELISDRFHKALENESALERVQSAEAAAEADLAAIDERIGLTRNALAALVGAGPDRGLSIKRPRAIGGRFTGVPKDLPVNLIGRRPDIVAARARAEASSKRIDEAVAAYYPNINLAAAIGRQVLGLDLLSNGNSTFGSVGPAISLPIFDGGRRKAAKRSADASYVMAVATYDETLVTALHQVADAVTSQRHLVRRLSETRRSARAAEKAYTIVKNRYEGGLATYLEVLSAEDALISARRATAALRARAFALDVAMVRALGGGFRNPEKSS
ncbi:NodT family efflux transporter outer membrane factor (OMF) lipoprotein [Breoghania corrubedonensis]|uniref:NodT family efflux transporter outer membrane factor (OMF) lipoprotein n=1 Tax=Breoghania corrubedonensis TaxID=665038 RepID=A0A2T5V1P7_9HYPH|nr:efflux transporter outer membrane subunit [Breoghania corrubedonensis]PTW57684.1 NodT family efflux transporter outer membrane factor (OMF) lipoprotein [Breoghania corrubedonensis]